MTFVDARLQREVLRAARPLRGREDLSPLIESIADSEVVMLGEATHGTKEFYELRAEITRRLVHDHDFDFVAVEGDWPDAALIDRFVRGAPDPDERDLHGGRDVLARLDRWPTWMWANEEVAILVDWMRHFNDLHAPDRQVRFHGLDIYSLYKSISAVIAYLEDIDAPIADEVRERYGCFELHSPDEIAYARSTLHFPRGCATQAVDNLRALLAVQVPAGRPNGIELFGARQNARVVRDADRYYRTMLHGNVDSWNIRDRHMMETLELLLAGEGAGRKRAVVWAHNTHIGDYRATDMASHGLVNLGGLARERLGRSAVALVGFGTHAGRVVASHAWDGPTVSVEVPPARPGSYEFAMHAVGDKVGSSDMFFIFDEKARSGPLASVADHRAIGVVYDPRHESRGNYVPTALAERYDAFVFVDQSRALHPLATSADRQEIPETYPSGV